MYIIIIGGDSIGYHLSKELLKEGHEVLVLDKDKAKCEIFEDDLGSICMQGDGCEVATLTEAGASRADVFIAITPEDEDNLVACQVAKHKFNVSRTIARISNPKNEEVFRKLGIDSTISVTNLIMKHIEQEIEVHPLAHLLTLLEEGTEIVEILVGDDSVASGKALKDLKIPKDSILALLIRNGQKPRIPSLDTVFKGNDRLIAFTTLESETQLKEQFKPENSD